MKRILITGSRGWEDADFIRAAITMWVSANVPEGEVSVIVHGDCPDGADRMARDFAREAWWLEEESHPADWSAPCVETCRPNHRRKRGLSDYCPAAGMTRNDKMVELGADVCLAFIYNNSRGAGHTALAAEKAGIPTRRFEVRKNEQ